MPYLSVNCLVLQRSYLHGSVGPFLSLLGPSELKRTVPDGQLKVFVGTWNMNGKVIRAFNNDAIVEIAIRNVID